MNGGAQGGDTVIKIGPDPFDEVLRRKDYGNKIAIDQACCCVPSLCCDSGSAGGTSATVSIILDPDPPEYCCTTLSGTYVLPLRDDEPDACCRWDANIGAACPVWFPGVSFDIYLILCRTSPTEGRIDLFLVKNTLPNLVTKWGADIADFTPGTCAWVGTLPVISGTWCTASGPAIVSIA